jgi:hypothetical protein
MSTSNKTMRKPEVVEQGIAPAQHVGIVPQETRQPAVVDRTETSVKREGQGPAEAQTRAIAYEIYRARCEMGDEGDELGDWFAAESRLSLREEYYAPTNLGLAPENEMNAANVQIGGQVPPA